MNQKYRDEFYSSYSEVVEQLYIRKTDEQLKLKVLDYLGDDFPIFLNTEKQHGVLVRAIQTPNYEHWYVFDVMQELHLDKVFCNYTRGKLVMKNSEKYHLVKMCFVDGFNSNKDIIVSKKNIVNINESEGKILSDIYVKQGLSLVDFHKGLFEDLGFDVNFFDISQWFDHVRVDKDGYYAKFLALFLFHGVLFDNFLLGDLDEQKFFEEKVWPSFNFIKEKFGIKPLVLPALPIKDEDNSLFFFYNQDIKNIVKEKYDL